jgi:hypothetical protein
MKQLEKRKNVTPYALGFAYSRKRLHLNGGRLHYCPRHGMQMATTKA